MFKPSYWYYIVFAVCFLGFTYLEDYVRASYEGSSAIITYILGFIPNYLPAVGIPCFFYVALPHIFGKKHSITLSKIAQIYVVIFSCFGLIAWEFTQILLPLGTFDWHDVLWTLFGGITFYAIWKIHSNKYGTVGNFE